MKLIHIKEMTIEYESEQQLSDAFSFVERLLTSSGKRTGTFNELIIKYVDYNDTLIYGAYRNNIFTGYAQFRHSHILNKKYIELINIFILNEYRNKGIMSSIMWFIKNQYKTPIIDHGVLSRDGLEFYKSLNSTERFKLYWMNIIDGTIDHFQNAEGKLSKSGKTEWRVVIESDSFPLDLTEENGNLLFGKYILFNELHQ